MGAADVRAAQRGQLERVAPEAKPEAMRLIQSQQSPCLGNEYAGERRIAPVRGGEPLGPSNMLASNSSLPSRSLSSKSLSLSLSGCSASWTLDGDRSMSCPQQGGWTRARFIIILLYSSIDSL